MKGVPARSPLGSPGRLRCTLTGAPCESVTWSKCIAHTPTSAQRSTTHWASLTSTFWSPWSGWHPDGPPAPYHLLGNATHSPLGIVLVLVLTANNGFKCMDRCVSASRARPPVNQPSATTICAFEIYIFYCRACSTIYRIYFIQIFIAHGAEQLLISFDADFASINFSTAH